MNLEKKIILWDVTPWSFEGIHVCCLSLQSERASSVEKNALVWGWKKRIRLYEQISWETVGPKQLRKRLRRYMSDDTNISWKFIFSHLFLLNYSSVMYSAPAFGLHDLSQDPVARLTGCFLTPRHPFEPVHHPISPFTFLKHFITSVLLEILCVTLFPKLRCLQYFLIPPPPIRWLVRSCFSVFSLYLTILSSFCYTLKLEAAWSSEMFVKFYHIRRCNILGGAFPHSHENFMFYAMDDI